jgi:hypothetical protein
VRPPTKKVSGPKYDLVTVVLPVVRFAQVSKKRAIREVENRLGISERDAETFAREKVSGLVGGNYVESVEMQYDSGPVTADVYGVTDQHGGWYVKFYVEHGRIQVVSCHAPEMDLRCKDGTIVRKG